jgi:hypothetical protein
MKTKEIEIKEVKKWFYDFRPDLSVNDEFLDSLYDQFLVSRESLSLDERGSFYAYVVTNYKSSIIEFIYTTLEHNWNETFEVWEEENQTHLHIKNLKELIDSKDPIENQDKHPHLEFNEANVNEIYLNIINDYMESIQALKSKSF